MTTLPSGYREIQHTADWELAVWALDLPTLLEQAARGMYALSGMKLHPEARSTRRLELAAPDGETLLVRFLSELLYLGEQESLGFDTFSLRLQPASPDPDTPLRLYAELTGAPLSAWDKEIKAVTYHNLSIRQTGEGLAVQIVFDV